MSQSRAERRARARVAAAKRARQPFVPAADVRVLVACEPPLTGRVLDVDEVRRTARVLTECGIDRFHWGELWPA